MSDSDKSKKDGRLQLRLPDKLLTSFKALGSPGERSEMLRAAVQMIVNGEQSSRTPHPEQLGATAGIAATGLVDVVHDYHKADFSSYLINAKTLFLHTKQPAVFRLLHAHGRELTARSHDADKTTYVVIELPPDGASPSEIRRREMDDLASRHICENFAKSLESMRPKYPPRRDGDHPVGKVKVVGLKPPLSLPDFAIVADNLAFEACRKLSVRVPPGYSSATLPIAPFAFVWRDDPAVEQPNHYGALVNAFDRCLQHPSRVFVDNIARKSPTDSM